MTATTGVWSPTRIASIAPDDRVAAAGLKLSATGAWTGLGRSENLLWGQYRSSGGTTCQVHADLSEPAFRCSCSSEKFPCKHVIGLLHLWRDGRVDEEVPTNVVRTQQGENGTGGTDEAAAGAASAVADTTSATGATDTTGAAALDDGAPADSDQRPAFARISAHREQSITNGLSELDHWLSERVERGITTADDGLPAALRRLAARMVDAQAPALAPRLADLADLADLAESAESARPVGPAEPTDVGNRGSDWERTAIAEFGAMHLLVRAWQERAHLPTDLVASVFQHLGVSVRNEIVLAEPEVEDHWVVAGSQDRAEGRIMARHSWLYGRRTGRWARIIAYARKRDALPRTYTAGTQVRDHLHFYPGASLRALATQEYPATGAVTGWAPVPWSIPEARAAWRDALAADPWADARPAIVAGRLAIDEDGRLALSDGTSMMPLAGGSRRHRRLALSAASDSVVVAGVLLPEGLQPLSLVIEGTVMPL